MFQQDLDYLRKIPILKGKSLADPYFGQPGRVDLLLGVVHANQCSTINVTANSDRKFRATETMFGWVIKGGSTIESKSCRPTICLRADFRRL